MFFSQNLGRAEYVIAYLVFKEGRKKEITMKVKGRTEENKTEKQSKRGKIFTNFVGITVQLDVFPVHVQRDMYGPEERNQDFVQIIVFRL